MAQHRLAVLTGQVPEALIAALDAPIRPVAAVARDHRSWHARRPVAPSPDVAAAEAYRLHAATARVSGGPRPTCSPRLSLGGLLGSSALSTGALFEAGSASQQRVPGRGLVFPRRGAAYARASLPASRRPGRAGPVPAKPCCWRWRTPRNALVLLTRTRSGTPIWPAAEQRARAEQLAQPRFTTLGAWACTRCWTLQRDLYAAQDAAADNRAHITCVPPWRCARRWPAAGRGQSPARPMMALQ